MANCITKYFTKKGKTFTDTPNVVVEVNLTDNVIWKFYSNESFIGSKGYERNIYINGKWRCDGDENFIIIGEVTKTDGTKKNQTFSSKDNKWVDVVPDTPAQLDSEFSCVTNGLTSMGKSFQIKDNLYVVADYLMSTGYHAIGEPEKPTIKWYFYKPKQGTRTWVEYNQLNKGIDLQGTWSCFGESNFKLTRSDGKTYVGGDTSWKDETQPEATTEPEQTTEPVADDSFPLKVGKEGPNVVKLQKFLNDKIPSNPLTVNGKFDEKTKNKLIEYQKKEGIIE